MKNKLIILSDLWGVKKGDWWHFYLDALNPYFEITFYDCAKLAQVDVAPNEKKNHEQFVIRLNLNKKHTGQQSQALPV